jgi:hypothetical protein
MTLTEREAILERAVLPIATEVLETRLQEAPDLLTTVRAGIAEVAVLLTTGLLQDHPGVVALTTAVDPAEAPEVAVLREAEAQAHLVHLAHLVHPDLEVAAEDNLLLVEYLINTSKFQS